MKRPLIGVHKFLQLSPEELAWQGLCLLSLLLAGLKVSGLLLLSWWWVLAPVVIPLVVVTALVILCITVVACVGSLIEPEDDIY